MANNTDGLVDLTNVGGNADSGKATPSTQADNGLVDLSAQSVQEETNPDTAATDKPGFFEAYIKGSHLLNSVVESTLNTLQSGDDDHKSNVAGSGPRQTDSPYVAGYRGGPAMQFGSNAWNLLEGNTFANDARILTGTSDYAANVHTLNDLMTDTNQRIAGIVADRQAGRPADMKLYTELQQRQQQYSTQLQSIADAQDHKSSIVDNMAALGSQFADNPTGTAGAFLAGMTDSVFQDPEMAFLGGETTAIKRIVAANGIAAKVANFGVDLANNKFVRGSINGSAMIAPIDMSQQMNQKGGIDLGQTGNTLVAGMVLGVLGKGIFNEADNGKFSNFIKNKIAGAMGSGKDPIGDVVGKADAISDLARAYGVAGGDYSVESITPKNIVLKSKQMDAEIERLAKEPVGYIPPQKIDTKGISVSETPTPRQIDLGKTPSPTIVHALSSLDSLPLGGYDRPNLAGMDLEEITDANPESITLGTPARRTSRAFNKPENQQTIPTIAITGDTFAADVMDDDGYKMGESRGFIDGNTIQPLVNAVADRDTSIWPKSVYDTWENLTKYALSTGRQFISHIYASQGDVDFFDSLKAKGYRVIENTERAFDTVKNQWQALDWKPLYKVTGHETGAGAPELLEAKKSLTDSYNSYMAGSDAGRQGGFSTQKALSSVLAVALFGTGFGYGYKQQKSIMDGFKYGGLAMAATLIPAALGMMGPLAKGVKDGLSGVGKEHYELGTFGEQFNNKMQQGLPYKAYVLNNAVNAILGPTEQHHDLFMWLNGDKDRNITANETELGTKLHGINEGVGAELKARGILEDTQNDFFSRWVKPGPNAPEEAKANWGKYKPWKSRNYAQGIEGFNQLQKDGFVPVTENVGDIMQNYLTTAWRAIELHDFTNDAKAFQFNDGTKAVLPQDKAPRDYVPLVGPLYGYSGHPDVARDFNFLLDFPKFGDLGKAYDFVNYGMKRGQLGLALFHPGQLFKNYTFAAIGRDGLVGPGEAVKALVGSVNPNSNIHQMIKNGDPAVQDAINHGVTYSLGRTPEDFGNDQFYGTITNLSEWLDKQPLASGPKALVDVYGKLNHLNDKLAFEMMQNYFKTDTFMREVQKQTQAGWNLHLRQPDAFPEPDLTSIKKGVASYVNDLFGGENYYQIVQDSNNWLAKNIKSELFNPSNRRQVLQRSVYAPDWTLSVARTFTQAIPGLSDSSLSGALHRRFLMGLAAMTFTVANALNYNYSGKPIWKNDNPGYIDVGNGYQIQWDKQLSEITDAIQDPAKWTLNRVAAVPRLGLEVLLNRQYLSRYGAPPIVPKNAGRLEAAGDYAAHTAAQYLPIAAHQTMETSSGQAEFNKTGVIAGVSSMTSFPIYKKPGASTTTAKYDPRAVSRMLEQYRPKRPY